MLAFFRRLTMVPQGVTIVVAAFLPIFAIVSMFPAVPSIIDHFAADPAARWKVPMMVSAPGLTIAILAPFAGFFIDRFGRRPLLLGATLLYGVVGSAPFFADSLDFLFVCRLLLGVSEAVILTTMNTLIGDYWEDRGRRDWLLLQGIAGPFLSSGVILLAGPATAWRWNGIFLIYLVAFPVFAASWAYLYETKPHGEAVRAEAVVPIPFPTRAALQVALVTLLVSSLYYVFIINGGLAFREVGVIDPSRLSELTAGPSLFVIAGALLFRLLAERAPALQLGVLFALLGTGLVGIGLSPDYRWMLVFLCIQQTGAGMGVPALIAWAQTRFPAQHRGRCMGIWTAAFFFGQFSSPFLVHNAELAAGHMQGAFLLMGAIGLAAALAALLRALRATPSLPPAETTHP